MAITGVMSRLFGTARGAAVSLNLNSLNKLDLTGSDNDFFGGGCPRYSQVDLNRGKTESCNEQNCQTSFGGSDCE